MWEEKANFAMKKHLICREMLSRLIYRPIAVTMSIIAVAVLGLLALKYIPVSLMPDIDIPQIMVQMNMPGYSAQEIEHDVVAPLRGQLMQVAGAKDVRSSSRMDAGQIVMKFDPGSNIDLLFIEVNEKIDRAMNTMPKELDRPKIIKASASDIPAFFLDVYRGEKQKASATHALGREMNASDTEFASLGQYVRNVVSKRIEQMPQVAMVDISGTVGTEIMLVPDYEKLYALGLQPADIEEAIKKNNITLEALSVVDGIYRYNIHFDSQLLTKNDVADIYINHNGRLIQLKDIATITEQAQDRSGMVLHDKENAVTLAVIKQNDARMEDLEKSMDKLLEDLRKDNPGISFELTRDQTQLLAYTISNLKLNLVIAALLACLILFAFIRQWRLSLLVIITIPLSLILTAICFYIVGISMNIVSLSGLILGIGMIVDNSIIVIDNILRRWKESGGGRQTLAESIVKGTGEVFTPMLSSVLTTCSVFLPLIFLSGIAGALFFDQAMGVTVALLASLLIASVVVPVYFYALYRNNDRADEGAMKEALHIPFMQPYEKVMKLTLRNARGVIAVSLLLIPLAIVLFNIIEKQRLPHVPHEDALMTIDWNAGISAAENRNRILSLIDEVGDDIESTTSMIGTQQFLLSHTNDITTSEAIVYLKTGSEEKLNKAKAKISEAIRKKFSEASVEFGEAGNIYDMIFSSDESDLEIHIQDKNGERPPLLLSQNFNDTLKAHFPDVNIMPVMSETNIRYVADTEEMARYHVNYDNLYKRLKELVSRNRIFEINDGAQPVPVIIGDNDTHWSEGLLMSTIRNGDGVDIPLSYLIKETRGEDYKRLTAGKEGGYYEIAINAKNSDVKKIIKFADNYVKQRSSKLSASYTGSFFSSRKLIADLFLVLAVAVALLFFILAAQFESFIQPFIILIEIIIDIFFVFLFLWISGESLNVMSMIGLVVMSGIVINDSILKIDTINRLRHGGMSLTRAVVVAGQERLRPIIMTSLTTILALVPFLSRGDMGSALQYPLSVTIIVGMIIGTAVSLFYVPSLYWIIAKTKERIGRKRTSTLKLETENNEPSQN